MIKKRRSSKVRTGFLTALVTALTLGSLVAAQDKKPVAHAVVAGTVFRDPGLALPGATVVLLRKDDPKAKKLQEGISNYRGEFAFEVPATQAAYVVRASLKGFHPDEKEALISADERIEVTLVLVPESKK